MKFFHFSDNHGELKLFEEASKEINFTDIDIIVSTGDFFPNCTRGNSVKEKDFQNQWFDRNADFFKRVFAGKPVLIVNGNHDYVCLAEKLLEHGYREAIKITPEGRIIEGITYAGFDEVPHFMGEWNRETDWQELEKLVERAFFCSPNVLITHAPTRGVLDNGIGIESLLTAFCYRTHQIKHHLFGHNHHQGGKIKEEMGTRFYNNACTGLKV